MTTELLKQMADSEDPPLVILENCEHNPVACIDMKKWYNMDLNPVISTTKTSERYYIFLKNIGVGIYFTYIRRIQK